jgi:hypothetical protein
VENSARILLPSVCLLASAVCSAQPAPNDLKITTRYVTGSQESTTSAYYSGEKSRSEMQFSSGDVLGHHRAVIRLPGADKVQSYDLDLDAHEYISFQTDLRGGALGAKPIAMKPSGKTFVINTDTVDTGERKEMFGHTARHLITRETRIGGPENCYGGNRSSQMDGWYIDFDIFPAHPPKQEGFVVAHFAVGSNGDRCYDKIEVHRTGPRTGFPLKLKTTLTSDTVLADNSPKTYASVTEMEVVELVEAPLDPALFQVPSGFKKVNKIIDPTQRLQARTYWDRFKEGLYSLFH